MRLKKETLNLECVLTDPEKLVYSKELAGHITANQRHEDSLKSFKSQIGAEIAGHTAQINLLSEKLNTGHEYRAIECEVKYDWKKKIRQWIRSDNKKIVKDDIIPEHELQEEMNFQAKKKKESKEPAKKEDSKTDKPAEEKGKK